MTHRALQTVLLLGGLVVLLLSLASAVVLADALGGHVVALVVGCVCTLGALSLLRGELDPAMVGGVLTAYLVRRLRQSR